MEGLVIRAFLTIITLMIAVTRADESQCISNYQKLERIFTSNDENYGNLSEAFYSTNRINSHYVIVNYQITQCDTAWQGDNNLTECSRTGVEKWIWSYSIVHVLFHPYSLSYLSFWYDNTDNRMNDVSLTLPPLCKSHKDQLLSRLTQLLGKYAKSREQITFDDNDNLGRSYKADEVNKKFNTARIFCIIVSYGTSIALLLICLQIASRPKRKVIASLVPLKHSNILYSCSLVWIINIIWVMYLDYTILMDHSTLNTLEYTHSQKPIYFIVIADFVLIAFVLITTPFLCKQTFFQRSCKLSNNYVTASKEYLVISTFMMFAVIHANHLVFIIFGFLVEPIHALAKLIEFITTVAYFISIFNIIFHYHRKHKDGRMYQFFHYTKLAFKLIYFYLYFFILFFTFSYLFYDDLIVTEHQRLIKSISISTLIWLVIIALYFSDKWSGIVNPITRTTSSTTTAATTITNKAPKLINCTSETDQRRPASYELREPASPTIDSVPQRTDQEPLIDTSTKNSEV